MKKTIKFCFAAIAILTVASCTKENLTPANEGGLYTYSIGFDATKTNITDADKTVWAEGDSLWISNGAEVASFIVPAEFHGKAQCTFDSPIAPPIFVVYPATAAVAAADGKVTLNVPVTQDGTFGSANICAGKSDNYSVKLRNATALLKVEVSDAATDVKTLSVSAPGSVLSGTCDVAFGDEGITVTPGQGPESVVVPDAAGVLYLSVIPGTYAAGFQLSAISEGFTTETKATVSAKTLKANDIASLGSIGTNLSSPEGDGTEGSPYLITNLAEWLALAYFVNADPGNTCEDQYFKVTNDISGINVPVGGLVTEGEESTDYYFKGHLDGNGKLLTVCLDGKQTIALVGDATTPATFKDIKVAGTANASGNYAAGIAAMVNGGTGVTFTNCESSVDVTGNQYVGGISGYTDGTTSFTNCSNSGNLYGAGHWTGGIAAIAKNGTFTECSNSGNIENKAGQCTGGILGKNSGATVIKKCTNGGTITTHNGYTGGILGYSSKLNIEVGECVNNGEVFPGCVNTSVTSSGALSYTEKRCYAGGVIGYIVVEKGKTVANIYDCTNNGNVTASSTGGDLGGVIGWLSDDAGENGSTFTRCKNTGKVTGLVDVLPNTSDKPTVAYYCGGIVGWHCRVYSSFLENTGEVYAPNGEYVGGISGTNRNARILDCSNSGKVTGGKMAAGIVCYQNWSQCNRCINTGDVTATIYRAGGIVAYNHKAGGIYSCGNEGKISGPHSVGGVCGFMDNQSNQNMSNCYNTGDACSTDPATTSPRVGGIAGQVNLSSQAITINNVYNTGKVTALTEAETAVGPGALFGEVAKDGLGIRYGYSLVGAAAAFCGKGTYTDDILWVGSDGIFAEGTVANVNEAELDNPADALNEWIVMKNATWLTWVFNGTKPGFGPMYVVQ